MMNYLDRLTSCISRLAAASLVVLLLQAGAAHAQLRIVSYNTSTGHNNASGVGIKTARAGMDIILESIGEESINGIARPIDVLLLQEQFSMSVSTQSFVDVLNGIYGPGTYARSFVNGATSEPNGDAGRPGLVYNTNTIQLVEEVSFGTVNGTNQARSTMRYGLRPVGYDDAAIFYAYNDHYKAGSATSDKARREIEATSIRENVFYGSDVLGAGAHAIFVGDYNMQASTEDAFQTLIAAGDGQANDPINRLGTWNNNSLMADVHTQAPCLSGCASDMIGGGMDDRFDFQLMTGEFLDGEGFTYLGPTSTGMGALSHSYHTFGNNGTTYNDDINDVSNTYPFTGVTSYSDTDILNVLRTVSDHLPVVADFQLPALLSASAESAPLTLNLDDVFDLDVMVSNAAPVTLALGADELDYSISTSGDLSGSTAGMDPAAGGGNTHANLVLLDTSTIGSKSGTITVSATSQNAGNSPVLIPISFTVLSALAGDYNNDGIVDGGDYTVWRDHLDTPAFDLYNEGATEGTVTEDDFALWRANFGNTLPPGSGSGEVASAAVPEPGSWLLLVVGACLASLRGGRLGSWTRKR